MEKIKRCRECKEDCPRPRNTRENGYCLKIIKPKLPNHWEALKRFGEKGYKVDEEMLFRLQEVGLSPDLYLSDRDLRLLWETKVGEKGLDKIIVHSLIASFVLRLFVDLDPPNEGIHQIEDLVKIPIRCSICPEVFSWRERNLIGFFTEFTLKEIEKGFYQGHALLTESEDIAHWRRDLKKELRLNKRKLWARNFWFKNIYKSFVASPNRSKDIFPEERDVYCQIAKLYILMTNQEMRPESIKNIIHSHD